MSNRMMLLALVAVSAAFIAIPALATANENHVEGATGKTFSGTGGPMTIGASGEPTISCAGVSESGSFTTETTGELTVITETCSTTILGISLHCRTSPEATGVIKMTNVFHLITIGTTGKPGILLTPPFPTIICGEGVSERKLQMGGNGVIGTITSPACGASSKSLTIVFNAPSHNQEHKLFTGTTYDLTMMTEPSGPTVTAGLTGHTTWTFNDGASRRLVCT